MGLSWRHARSACATERGEVTPIPWEGPIVGSQHVSSGVRLARWLDGSVKNLSGSTIDEHFLETRKAQRFTHSMRTFTTELAGVRPAEHRLYMIDSAKADNLLIASLFTPLVVAQSEQAT